MVATIIVLPFRIEEQAVNVDLQALSKRCFTRNEPFIELANQNAFKIVQLAGAGLQFVEVAAEHLQLWQERTANNLSNDSFSIASKLITD